MCHLFDFSGVGGLGKGERSGARVREKHESYTSSRSFTDHKTKALEQ